MQSYSIICPKCVGSAPTHFWRFWTDSANLAAFMIHSFFHSQPLSSLHYLMRQITRGLFLFGLFIWDEERACTFDIVDPIVAYHHVDTGKKQSLITKCSELGRNDPSDVTSLDLQKYDKLEWDDASQAAGALANKSLQIQYGLLDWKILNSQICGVAR
jgi:hypothetical protein